MTLAASRTVGDITFSSDGYTLGKTIFSDTLIFANDVSYTVTNTGHTATISANVGMWGGVSTNALTKLGDGKLILSGGKNYSGDTTVSAGILEIRQIMPAGKIINNASLILNMSSDQAIVYGYGISGSGDFTQTGAGTLRLTGTNTYSGATTVSGGTLAVNGSLTNSALTVASSGDAGRHAEPGVRLYADRGR